MAQMGFAEKLTSLDLSNNTLKVLPVEIYSLINLKTLNAYNCSIQRVYDLNALDKLQTLRLDNNDLEIGTIGALPVSLKAVNLLGNHFIRIPEVLYGLPNLAILDLSGNRITTLDGIGNIVTVIELYLNNNEISEIPAEIGNLHNLQIFAMKNNKLTKTAISYPGQSISAALFIETDLRNCDLTGNEGLTTAEVFKFDGVEVFLQRRKGLKDKNLLGGALMDTSLFGLE